MQKNNITSAAQLGLIIGLAAFIFLVYLFSLCPTVYLIDSGELATVSYTLGIAHPTGYPLYTLIAYFFSHLPGEPIKNLNILSSLFSVFSAIVIYLTAREIIRDKFVPVICAVLFAFSPTLWRTSITNEVYPLTGLFAVLLIFWLYRMRDKRSFYLIAYLMGLSLTNHVIVFSLAIPVFFYLIMVYRPNLKTTVLGIIFALSGLSLYFYVIARTIGGAELTWGNAYNLQRLVWHITGKQYQVWMFSLETKEIIGNLGMGLKMLLSDFLFVPVVFIFIGFYHLFRFERHKFWLFLTIVGLNIGYTLNYSIPDIQPYYIPSLVALIIVWTYGLKMLLKYIKWFVVLPISVLVPLINYGSCTMRNNTFGLDFGLSHIEQLPASSVLICNYWDVYSPLLYAQQIKGIRSDLIIIDKELLRRTWYIQYLRRRYPEFYRAVKNKIEDYLMELYKFEYNKPYNPYIIQSKFIQMLDGFVDAQSDKAVYFALSFPDNDLKQVKPNYQRIPRGLVLEIRKDSMGYIPFDFSRLSLDRPEVINDERLRFNLAIVEQMVKNNILYLVSTKRFEEANQARNWRSNFY